MPNYVILGLQGHDYNYEARFKIYELVSVLADGLGYQK